MNTATQNPTAQVPTEKDDLGAIPLEGSGFEDQQLDPEVNESEAQHG
jgi:hypothetical protein